MSDYIKETTISDLKKEHSDKHGFLFRASNKSSDDSIANLAGVLKLQGITRHWPLLVTRLEQGIVFVYEDFDGPRFWQIADHAKHFMGIECVPLCFFLNGVKVEEKQD